MASKKSTASANKKPSTAKKQTQVVAQSDVSAQDLEIMPLPTLEDIVKATQSEAKLLYTSAEVHANLIKDGLVEINTDLQQLENGVLLTATRATQKGIDKVMGLDQAAHYDGPEDDEDQDSEFEDEGEDFAAEGEAAFALEDGIQIPSNRHRYSPRKSIFPFLQMQVGNSFFVPIDKVPLTEKTKDPVRCMSHILTNMNSRFSEDHPTETRENRNGEIVPKKVPTRKWEMRNVMEGRQHVGIRVWRVL